ncbi:MAG: copper chaperone PCu(A)C [Ignavibacteriales bacterium]|nr:MAG: copper chaperone PCu(A)C [Ignavibacteriales bacterium]
MFYNLLTLILGLLVYQQSDELKIKEPWIRPGAKDMSTAFYFIVENQSDKPDTLYKVSSELAGKVEIHETYMKDDMMGMREVEQIVIPPKSEFHFKPRAHHVMLMKLKNDLKNGDTGKIKLYFKSAGEYELSVQVKSPK